MTADAFIKIIKEQPRGTVLMITGDDGIATFYTKENEEIKIEDIKKYGTDEYDHVLVTRGFITSKPEKNGKGGKRDIPVKVYRSLTTIRDIMVLENPKDKARIDLEDLHSI